MAILIRTEEFPRFDRLAFVPRRAARAGLGGEHRSRRRSPSTDYVDFRAYQPGDDFRRVDWNVYGRLGSLQVKLTEGRESLEVVLLLDCSSSMDYGQPDKLSFGAQLAAALAYVGMARADSVRIALLGHAPTGFGPFARRRRLPQVIERLARIAPTGLVDLNTALTTTTTTTQDTQRPPLIVILSDLLAPTGVAAGLDALQILQADLVVLHLISPEEAEPDITGEVELVDAETNHALDLGVSLDTLAAYRARFAAWLDQRRVECLERGIRYVRVRTDQPLASVMLDDLRRAAVLR